MSNFRSSEEDNELSKVFGDTLASCFSIFLSTKRNHVFKESLNIFSEVDDARSFSSPPRLLVLFSSAWHIEEFQKCFHLITPGMLVNDVHVVSSTLYEGCV